MIKNTSKKNRIEDLFDSVQFCNLCPRLCNRTKVLSYLNGNINSKVLFVAEAPGRLGADRTGIPLYGDRTGNNFESLLGNIGWKREEIFITNALLCNPRTEDGNNSTPSREELLNCSPYLEMVINILQPEVVVSLGALALQSLDLISPHYAKLNESVATILNWYGRKLIPLYHPGPRAILHRSIPKQRSDFFKLDKYIHPLKGIKNKPKDRFKIEHIEKLSILQEIIIIVVQNLKQLSYFKLTKLLYLIDLFSLDRFSTSISGELYLRQEEGPWPPSLKKSISLLKEKEICSFLSAKIPMVRIGPNQNYNISLDDEKLEFILEIINKYGNLSNTGIKIATYKSNPMRYVLEQEKLGRDLRRIPILDKNRTIIDIESKVK